MDSGIDVGWSCFVFVLGELYWWAYRRFCSLLWRIRVGLQVH